MSLIAAQILGQYGAKTAAEIEDRAITVRPSATALFCIDSKDRYDNFQQASVGTISPYAFQITSNQSLVNGFFRRLALTEIVFPYYIANINTRTNRLSISKNGGAFQTLTIATLGFYSPTQIAAIIQAGLLAAPFSFAAGTTCTYSEGRFTIQTGGTDTIALRRATFAGGATVNQFQLIDLMGFNTALALVASGVLISKVTRCRYTEFVDIVCSQLTYNQDLKDGSSATLVKDSLARVYIETEDSFVQPYWNGTTQIIAQDDIPGTYPFTINRKFPHPKQIQWNNTQPIGNLIFEVYDDKGDLLSGYGLGPLAPGDPPLQPDSGLPDWRMTLLLSEN
jgi:hypothetical protein